jgi:hypothetical protein
MLGLVLSLPGRLSRQMVVLDNWCGELERQKELCDHLKGQVLNDTLLELGRFEEHVQSIVQ